MKKLLSILLILSILLGLAACGGKSADASPAATPTPKPASSQPADAPQSGGSVEVDERLLTVELTLPASFFEDEDMSTFDAKAYAEENGYHSAAVNEDGSVSIVMSKARHKEIMAELHAAVEQSFDELIGAEDTPYITDITFSDSFDKVNIIVDKAGYESGGLMVAFLPMMIYIPVGMYHVFDGTDAAKCEISFIADGTGELLASQIYPDALEAWEDDGADTVFDESAYITDEITVVDNDVCTMKITGIDPNGDWGFTFNVYCDNKTNAALMFSMDSVSVNGFMCDPFWATEIPAGKKENSSFEFSASQLNRLGISVVDEVEFLLRVSDSEDWLADPHIEETFAIYPTGLSAAEVSYPQRTPVIGETVCVDDENCTFVITSVNPDGDWGYTLNCYLENKTDRSLGFYWNDVSVNGFMLDPYWGDSVAAGKRAYSEISFDNDRLSENGIDTVTEIEYTLQIRDADAWDIPAFVDAAFVFCPAN